MNAANPRNSGTKLGRQSVIVRFLMPLMFIVTLASCDIASTVKDGIAKADSAATAIERRVGTKPQIGFNYHNGGLSAVTVQFTSVPVASIVEIEKIAREEVNHAFQSLPSHLVISFVFKSAI